MSSEQAVYRRLLRREMHSSRAGAAIVVAVVLIVFLAAIGAGCVVLVAHLPALAVVDGVLAEVTGFRAALRYPVMAGGIVVTVLGVVVALLGLLPGRKARRRADSARAAVVIDDSVIANAIADQVSWATGADRSRVKVVIGRRRVDVRIIPTSGVPVGVDAVAAAAFAESTRYGLTRRPRVRIAERGVVG